ncbi:MAG: VOC family protein [Candidatus Hatepunaea meridiana]|nr:VOC family protein [Candidatus Hatepunaea meridiana]
MKYQLGLVQINVTDRKKAEEFYVHTLGFKKILVDPLTGIESGGDNDNGPFFLDSGCGFPILLYPLNIKKGVQFDYPNQTGVILVIYMDDIDKTYRDWRAKGVEFIKIAWSEEESGIAGCPFGRFIAVRDPFGNVFEILQPFKHK